MSKDSTAPGPGGEADASGGFGDPAMPGLVGVLRRVDAGLGLVEQIALAFLLLVLVGVGTTQAISNQLFNVTFHWSEQALRLAVFWTAMFGAALSAQAERMIAMDFVSRMLPEGRRAVVRQVLRVFTIAICVAVVKASLDNFASLGREVQTKLIPSDIGSLALPIGAGLIALHLAIHLVVDVAYLARGVVPPQEGALSLH